MSPTYSQKDMARIAGWLGMKPAQLRDRWLVRDRQGDWINQSNPCQFLDLENNHCRIYDVRPADCAGFPHHGKKLLDYLQVYKQNLEHCPATYRMLTRLQEMLRRPSNPEPDPIHPAQGSVQPIDSWNDCIERPNISSGGPDSAL
jgi:hypothetical protein